MRLMYVLPLVLLTACPELGVRFVPAERDDTGAPDPDTGKGPVDDDGDGFSVDDGDCDDANATIYPSAPDGKDGVDNDCDGMVDEGKWDGGGGKDTGRGGGGKDTGFGGGGKDTGF